MPSCSQRFAWDAGFGNAIGLTWVHEDQAVVGWKRSIVGIDGIEGERGRGRQIDNLPASLCEQAAQRVVLRLRGGKVGVVMKSQVAPCGGFLGTIPTCIAWRAHQDAQQIAGH